MKLSWSHKLFFQANRLVGRISTFDAIIKFWAEYAIFLFGFLVLLSLFIAIPDLLSFVWACVWSGVALFTGVLISFTIAWIWPHHRPKVEFPEITELITPLSHWKSLPSDHSLISWILVGIFYYYTQFGFGADLAIGLIATIICVSRVLAGVHYPRDILAGTVLGWVVALVFFR